MIINSLFRHRQSIAIVMISVFFADLIGFRYAYAGGGKRDAGYHRAYEPAGSYLPAGGVRNLFNGIKNDFDHSEKESNTSTNNKKVNYKKIGKSGKGFIGGPGQPEMQAFQSVGANNLVNLFTGDFSYNIPLLDVGGYPLGLSYSGGASMDQEASWVGLGWNVNPGTIMRNVRGLPDDFNGSDSIIKELNTKKKWTAGVNVGFSPEIFSKDLSFLKNTSPSLGLYYDNYTGPGFNLALTPGLNAGESAKGDKTFGVGNLQMGVSFDSKSGFNINPTYSAKLQFAKSVFEEGNGSIGLNYNSRAGLQNLQVGGGVRLTKMMDRNKEKIPMSVNTPQFTTSISFASPTFTPSITMPTSYAGFTFRLKGGGEFFGFHPLASLSGYYNQSVIAEDDRVQKLPAYGYLHLTKSQNDQLALMDFNREKDIPFRDNTPNIAVPLQTYDVFSISGEGIGGSFRAYRGDVGVMRDHKVVSKSTSANFGFDVGGVPNLAEFGADVRFTFSSTENTQWMGENVAKNNLVFKSSDSTYESVYFRNPGEQSSNTAAYYNSIGDDDLVRVNLKGGNYDPTASNFLARFNRYGQQSTLQLTKPVTKIARDKRNQVISYLNGAEATIAGLETEIRSYKLNEFPLGSCDTTRYDKILRNDGLIRKATHISEITVLNPDGRSYVYGIPAYNLEQQEITFAVDKSGAEPSKGLVSYSGTDLSQDNTKGKDGYFSKQTTPAHAHSYLLTALKSTDYVDVTGNGITDDDMGDAVKFNYTRMKWGSDYKFKWRTPTENSKAGYDEGLRTDNSDDKGNIIYGEKEVWYMNSIESKTMIATFKLDTDNPRKDAFQVNGINGGRDTTKSMMRLKEINLYSKADLKKYGSAARPIKTVNFSYSYRLCKGYPDLQDTATGKLTLESVWFTYNKNQKGQKNKYLFTYGNNPTYQYKAYDRWGNYKPSSDNPGGIGSDEYPYAVKDSTVAALNGAAWNLSEIVLPSGAKMKIQYESDDYGYVQNKRANEMFQVVGFGTSSSGSYESNLYTPLGQDHRFVYINVSSKVTSKKEVFDKYLSEQKKLYFRLHIKMPHDGYGSGYEYIPVYADYKDYGFINDNLIWIELQDSPEGNNKSPLATAAIQFLRLNLPSKAYNGSDVRNEPVLKAAIMAVLSIVGETKKLLMGGFNSEARVSRKSREAMVSRTFVRLSSPVLKKYGGGYRVKKITIHDNWQKMVNKKESVYGQEYRYTSTKVIGGKKQIISSGVASYEPSLGNEENPFHQPVEYKEKATLAPSTLLYVEEPFAESLFPSAGVGYSKVRVSSINRKNIKSATGFEESEFYTAYDFPTLTQRTAFDNDSYKKGIDKFNVFKVNIKKYITLSQGFKIELNDMHGKPKSTAVYSEADSTQPMTYTAQYYRCEKINGESFRLVNTVPVIDSANGKINMQGQIGKDIELVTDMREQFSKVIAPAANIDHSLFIIPAFIPWLLKIPSVFSESSIEKSRFRSVSMLKIIQRYGILDSVVHIDKGSKVSTRNTAWDGETGEVLLTETQNEFNDPVYQFNYPAHWAYSGAGLAYKNIDAVFKNVNVLHGQVGTINGAVGGNAKIERICESGDEILVLNTASNPEFHICYGDQQASTERKLWVVDRGKSSGGSKDLYLVDRNGTPYTASGADLRITRSGRRNMATTPIGSIVSLKSPIKIVNDTTRIIIDSTIEVVSAGAAVMKDKWSVEDRFYKLTTCDSGTHVVDTIIYPVSTALARLRIDSSYGNKDTINNNIDFSYNRFVASRFKGPKLDHGDTVGSRNYQTRGLVNFSLGFIPTNATIDSAILNLNAFPPRGLWPIAAYYWDSVNRAHTVDINQSELLHIKRPWNGSTTFLATDTIVTSLNSVTLSASTSNCQNYAANVRNMLQAMIEQPDSSNGILLRLSKDSPWSTMLDSISSNDSVNHMSFCTGPDADSTIIGCNECASMALNVKYHFNNDTCSTDCRSIFDQKINPYVHGIWGNWRGWRSYVYYDNREQTDPNSLTNIRTDGVIDRFKPYWAMTSTGITNTSDTSVWVWNSEITRYNRRGLETENHDPLGRFNSGLYGYNNTLPVAVTQNARHRETAFEGFEDYGFSTDSCVLECPLLRHFDFSSYKDSITTIQKHSGKSSLRLGAGSVADIGIPVKTGNDSLSPELDFNVVPDFGVPCSHLDKIEIASGAVYPGFTPLPGKLMVVSAWVKEDKDCKCLSYTGNAIDFIFYEGGSQISTVSKYPSGNIIEGWQRYEDTVQVPSTADSMTVKLRNTTSVPVYFDDLRLFPHNSNMKSFVYHPTSLRLLAELDENNYASFYEYDDEGTLIRVKKETERGIKTISETRSALRKTDE